LDVIEECNLQAFFIYSGGLLGTFVSVGNWIAKYVTALLLVLSNMAGFCRPHKCKISIGTFSPRSFLYGDFFIKRFLASPPVFALAFTCGRFAASPLVQLYCLQCCLDGMGDLQKF
jgi:hypothetical protein